MWLVLMQPCPLGRLIGSTTLWLVLMQPCPKGTYSESSNAKSCLACNPGDFTSTTGNTFCQVRRLLLPPPLLLLLLPLPLLLLGNFTNTTGNTCCWCAACCRRRYCPLILLRLVLLPGGLTRPPAVAQRARQLGGQRRHAACWSLGWLAGPPPTPACKPSPPLQY